MLLLFFLFIIFYFLADKYAHAYKNDAANNTCLLHHQISIYSLI
jgi:hypothetical protein